MKRIAFISLPAHVKTGGFDHAAVQVRDSRLFVAHTANDALDVIDTAEYRYLYSIPVLKGVAGALVSEDEDLVFSSNRGENTIGIIRDRTVTKVTVGLKPNGLSYDSARHVLLAANVGDPAVPGSFTATMVDVGLHRVVTSIPLPGRTRWTVFDPTSDSFLVNVADPPLIAVIDAGSWAVRKTISIPARGPHGLDVELSRRRAFCACDDATLVVLDAHTGAVTRTIPLSGPPDVIFLNPARHHLYVAIGEPGVIDVIDTEGLARVEVVPTEKGAHTIGWDPLRNTVYAFLPQSCGAAVMVDE